MAPMTNIDLRTALVIPCLVDGQTTLPENVHTLRELLHYIGNQINFDIIDSISGNIHDDFAVRINGKESCFLPGGLDCLLGNNDTVEINIIGLGGG
jgi:hypothetical protein